MPPKNVLVVQKAFIGHNLVRKDGSLFSVEINARILLNRSIIAIVRDISERKTPKERLRLVSSKGSGEEEPHTIIDITEPHYDNTLASNAIRYGTVLTSDRVHDARREDTHGESSITKDAGLRQYGQGCRARHINGRF